MSSQTKHVKYEQLSLSGLEIPNKNEIYRIVVPELKRYPKVRLSLENAPLRLDMLQVESEEYQRLKEKVTKETIWIRWFENGWNHLSDLEQKILRLCYMKPKKSMFAIYHEVNMAKTPFYKKRDEAILKLAKILNLI